MILPAVAAVKRSAMGPTSRPSESSTDAHQPFDIDAIDADVGAQTLATSPPPPPPHLAESHELSEKPTNLSTGAKELYDSLARFRLQGNKELDIVLDRVTVQGLRQRPHSLRTVPDAFVEQLIFFATLGGYLTRSLGRKQRATDTLLSNLCARFEPGEMVFILAGPGSGGEEMLNLLAGRTSGFTSVEGRFEYAGIPAEEFARRHPAEMLYASAYDEHYPTVSVEDAVRLALRCKIPSVLPRGMEGDPDRFVQEALDSTLSMLGIDHVRANIIGNEHVRGVSGGERKRVSIAEVVATGCAVACWDQSIRGMDSSTALSFVKGLQAMSRLFGVINIASFYQVSDDILERFDKVVVLHHGRMAFYGPPAEVAAHFEKIGFERERGQTVSDFVDACLATVGEGATALPQQVDVAKRPAPVTPEDLERAMYGSPSWIALRNELDGSAAASAASSVSDVAPPAYQAFEEAVNDERRKGLLLGRTSFTVPFRMQINALLRRDLRRKLRDWPDLVALYAFNLVISIVIGTAYYMLPTDASGAFTRGGLLYLAILYPPFEAFGMLSSWLESTSISARHVEFRLASPTAHELSFWLTELPAVIPELFVFLIPLYLLSGLERTASAFFIAYLVVFGVYNAFFWWYRLTLYILGQDLNSVMRLNVIVLSTSVIYSGYLVPFRSLPNFSSWLYFINPARYAWQAMMINELGSMQLPCDASRIVPRNVDGLDLGYGNSISDLTQTCSIAGAEPASPLVSGRAYLETSFGFAATKAQMWENIGILFAFAIGLMLVALASAEVNSRRMRAQPAGQVAVRRGKPSLVAHADKHDVELGGSAAPEKEQPKALHPITTTSGTPRSGLTWSDISYDVPAKGGKKRLLHNISGSAPRGSLTALMGGSGAGKTTLLDVLARRKTIGTVNGKIRFAGRPTDSSFSRHLAYCEQNDVHSPTATVYEALLFSSRLRRPVSTTMEEHKRGVREVIELLGLTALADVQIGRGGKEGISNEARKKLTIGVELVAQPDSVVFLDEPTSGLDVGAASAIVDTLRKLADVQGLSVVCTIHQPSRRLFERFDRLMLLGRGGLPVYCGEIGEESRKVLEYFGRSAKEGFHRADANAAESIIELVSGDPANAQRWEERWRQSSECAALVDEVSRDATDAPPPADTETPSTNDSYPGFLSQLSIVTARELRTQWRMADYNYTTWAVHFAMSLIVGITWFQLGNTTTDLQNRIFAVFVTIFFPAFIFAQVQPVFMDARKVFVRESASGTYSRVVFAISQLVGQVPGATVATVLAFLPFYYMCGFPADSSRAGFFFLVLLIAELYAYAIGQAIAALLPNLLVCGILIPFILIVYELFAGVTIPAPVMISFWRSWLFELNPYTRSISALLTTILHDLPVRCGEGEVDVFLPPSGQTCEEYAGAFVSAVGKGYVVDPDATEACQYCPYRIGDEYTQSLGFEFALRSRDLGILIAHWAFAAIVLVVATRFINYNKR